MKPYKITINIYMNVPSEVPEKALWRAVQAGREAVEDEFTRYPTLMASIRLGKIEPIQFEDLPVAVANHFDEQEDLQLEPRLP